METIECRLKQIGRRQSFQTRLNKDSMKKAGGSAVEGEPRHLGIFIFVKLTLVRNIMGTGALHQFCTVKDGVSGAQALVLVLLRKS